MQFYLLPTVNGGPWSSENPRRNSHTFNCRMLVNPHSEAEETQDHEAQQKYETMQCFAVSEPKSIKEEGEGEPRFLKTHLKSTLQGLLFYTLRFEIEPMTFVLLLYSCVA